MRLNKHRLMALGTFLFLALLALALGTSNAAAQGQGQTAAPGVWASAINLQNISGSTANVVITFYDVNGSQIDQISPSPLAPGDAVSLYIPAAAPSLNPGQYAAVVSSDQPVLASVNTASTNSTSAPWTAFAYEGFDSSQASNILYFPGNYKNYFSFFSEIVVQNTDPSANATVQAQFYNQAGGLIATENLGSIAPNAAKTYPMNSFASLPSGNTNGIFGAKLTSTGGQEIVGIANIWRTTPFNGTASYSGFTSGSTTAFAPSLQNNYFGFSSALTVQNIGGTTANGTITYSNGTVTNFSLGANAAQAWFQPAVPGLPSGNTSGAFGATINATSGQVVALVSQSQPSGPTGAFSSYNVPSSATPAVNISSVLSDYFGYFTNVTVQNVGATPTNITITYAAGGNRVFNNVGAGQTINIIHLNNTGDILPNQTATSAVLTNSAGNNLVAVIQHNTAPNVAGYNPSKAAGDYLLAITGSPD